MNKVAEVAGVIGERYAITREKAAIRETESKRVEDLGVLRTMAIKELKRENIGVKRQGYDFVVDPTAVEAFVTSYRAARPNVRFEEPKIKTTVSLAKKEVAFLKAEQKRIAKEDLQAARREERLLAKLEERRQTLRLIKAAAAVAEPVIEKVRQTPQTPKLDTELRLKQLSFAF